MTTATKLVIVAVLGLGCAAIARGIRRAGRAGARPGAGHDQRARDLSSAHGGAVRPAGVDDAVADAVPPGLSDVDPAPLAHVTEAMDPDANRVAHTAAAAQRARLPVRGKNLP
jgi:hypothetical protein